MSKLKALVEEYLAKHANILADELSHYKRLSFPQLIEAVGYMRGEGGQRPFHQYRIYSEARYKWARILKAFAPRIRVQRNFSDLLKLVKEAAEKVRGIGVLAVYDSALRIGVNLGLEPEFVYLHAGTDEGAKRLGLKRRGMRSLTVDGLPSELQKLSPMQVEHFLCSFKSRL